MSPRWLSVVVVIAFGAGRAVGQDGTSVWTGVYATAQAERGSDLYYGTCAECHGNDFEGIEKAPALAGGTFGQRWDGTTLKKLFERIREMPPDDPTARLTDPQCADVLAFLLSANKIPAGTSALDPDTRALARLTFTAAKPK